MVPTAPPTPDIQDIAPLRLSPALNDHCTLRLSDRGVVCGASRLAALACGLPSGKPRSTRAFSRACRAWVI